MKINLRRKKIVISLQRSNVAAFIFIQTKRHMKNVPFNLQKFTQLVSNGQFVSVLYKKANGEITKRTIKIWAKKTSERYNMTGPRNYDRAAHGILQIECLGRKGPRVFKSSGVLAYKTGNVWHITENYDGENIQDLLESVDENVMKQSVSKTLTQNILDTESK